MTDLAAIITASVGALGTLGGGVAWLWNRIEKRFSEVDRQLAECRDREGRHQKTAAAHLTVIELLWQEVKRRSRGSPNDTLKRAGEILDDLKKPEAK